MNEETKQKRIQFGICPTCGGNLNSKNETECVCEYCGKVYLKQVVEDNEKKLREILDQDKQEKISNLRRLLWDSMHEKYIDSAKITNYARDLKQYLPEDYFANFCEVANSGTNRQTVEFLNKTSKDDMDLYSDVALDFMLKSVNEGNIDAIRLFIDKSFGGDKDPEKFSEYLTRYEEEAEKVRTGIYDRTITRDVFLAYSSADMDKVWELCKYLEKENISCFVAARNLKHGRDAVDNYQKAIEEAIDNCKTIVFVSSKSSRSRKCEAITKELPYIKSKDKENAPAEFKRDYEKMPEEYKMPRVQYLVEQYGEDEEKVALGVLKEFFADKEWCIDKKGVAKRVNEYLTERRETTRQRNDREYEEQQRKYEEQLGEVKKLAKKLEQDQTKQTTSKENVNTLLKRASVELENDEFGNAKKYYDRILDMMPNCSEAWMGKALAEFSCMSDNELSSKIKKANLSSDNEILFSYKQNKNISTARKFSEQLETLVRLDNECDEKLFDLCRTVSPGGKAFYRNVVQKNIKSKYPLQDYANYALFLTDYDCTSDDDIIKKFNDATISSGYDIVLSFDTNQDYKNIKLKDFDETKQKLENERDNILTNLCKTVSPNGKDFYLKVLRSDIDIDFPIKDYANYALFLTDYDCTSDAQLIQKFKKATVSEGYDELLSFSKNSYYENINVKDFDETKQKLEEKRDETLLNLCKQVSKSGEQFYKKVINLKTTTSIKDFAKYSLFLSKYDSENADAIIKKISKLTSSDEDIKTILMMMQDVKKINSIFKDDENKQYRAELDKIREQLESKYKKIKNNEEYEYNNHLSTSQKYYKKIKGKKSSGIVYVADGNFFGNLWTIGIAFCALLGIGSLIAFLVTGSNGFYTVAEYALFLKPVFNWWGNEFYDLEAVTGFIDSIIKYIIIYPLASIFYLLFVVACVAVIWIALSIILLIIRGLIYRKDKTFHKNELVYSKEKQQADIHMNKISVLENGIPETNDEIGYSVVLEKIVLNQTAVTKAIMKELDLVLLEVKPLVDKLPATLLENTSKEKADALKVALEEAAGKDAAGNAYVVVEVYKTQELLENQEDLENIEEKKEGE